MILNGQEITQVEAGLFQDRGFAYGDGLFETMIWKEGRVRFFKDHFSRLEKGMNVLGFDPAFNPSFTRQKLLRHIESLMASKGDVLEKAVVKLFVWRAPGGLFAPQSDHFNWALITRAFSGAIVPVHRSVGVAETINLSYSVVSRYKTLSSLPYIMAGKERLERALDEIIILNNKGDITEGGLGNVFWEKDGVYYTPPISTGCIAGVFRKNLIKHLRTSGFKVKKVLESENVLDSVDSIFFTNAAGVKRAGFYNGRRLQKPTFWKSLPTEFL